MEYTVPGALFDMALLAEADYSSRGDDTVSKEYWEETYQRPGLTWHDSLTEAEALVHADRADRKMRTDMILSKSDGSLGSTLTIFAGTFGSQLTDPTNWIPFGGLMSKAAGRIGKTPSLWGVTGRARSGRATLTPRMTSTGHGWKPEVTTVWEAGADIGMALALTEIGREASFYTRSEVYGETYDSTQGLLNVGLALGIGTGMGVALAKMRKASTQAHFNNLLLAQDEIWASMDDVKLASSNSFGPDAATAPTPRPLNPAEKLAAAETTKAQNAANTTPQTTAEATTAFETKTKVLNFLEKCFARMKGTK